MAKRKKYTGPCALEEAFAVFSGKWKAAILYHLFMEGPTRHCDLRKKLDGISQRILTQQLRALERDGIVTRTDYREVPPRVEYDVTELALTLKPLLKTIENWSAQHMPQVEATQRKYDEANAVIS